MSEAAAFEILSGAFCCTFVQTRWRIIGLAIIILFSHQQGI